MGVHQVDIGSNDTLHAHSFSSHRLSPNTSENFQYGSRHKRKGENTLNDFMNAILNQILGLLPSLIVLSIITIVYCFINPGNNLYDYVLFDFDTIAKLKLTAFLVYFLGTKKGTVTFNWSNAKDRIMSMNLIETIQCLGMMQGILQLTCWLRDLCSDSNDMLLE